jgi:DNA (cytosine-5)-methyltransferase 1
MLKFIDLFCGGGFGARGAIRGGGSPVMALDAWEVATQTYKANFPGANVIHAVLRMLTLENIGIRYLQTSY